MHYRDIRIHLQKLKLIDTTLGAQIGPLEVRHAHLIILATPMTWPNHFWLAHQIPDFTPLYYARFSHVGGGGKALSIFQSNVEVMKVNTNKEWDAMPVVDMTKIR